MKVKIGCKGSEGAGLVDGLVIKEEDYKLVKSRFSAFFATHLHSVLQATGIHNLVITGQCNTFNVNLLLTVLIQVN